MVVGINNSRISSGATSFQGGAPKLITVDGWTRKTIEWFGHRSTPTNRIVLGATALALQPMIDLHNKDVDEKTRKISCARTIAKAIAGTIVGVAVRIGCIKSIKSLTLTPTEIKELTDKGKKVPTWATKLIPNFVDGVKMTPESFEKATRLVTKHRESLGSFIALGVMLITNFLFDAPLTKFLTNMISDNMNNTDQKKADAKGGKQ